MLLLLILWIVQRRVRNQNQEWEWIQPETTPVTPTRRESKKVVASSVLAGKRRKSRHRQPTVVQILIKHQFNLHEKNKLKNLC